MQQQITPLLHCLRGALRGVEIRSHTELFLFPFGIKSTRGWSRWWSFGMLEWMNEWLIKKWKQDSSSPSTQSCKNKFLLASNAASASSHWHQSQIDRPRRLRNPTLASFIKCYCLSFYSLSSWQAMSRRREKREGMLAIGRTSDHFWHFCSFYFRSFYYIGC